MLNRKYLDYMAMLKMNVLHWHLTEGQGWMIETKNTQIILKLAAVLLQERGNKVFMLRKGYAILLNMPENHTL